MECNYCNIFTYDVSLHVTLCVTWRQEDVNIRLRIARLKMKSPRVSGDINIRVLIFSTGDANREIFRIPWEYMSQENVATANK